MRGKQQTGLWRDQLFLRLSVAFMAFFIPTCVIFMTALGYLSQSSQAFAHENITRQADTAMKEIESHFSYIHRLWAGLQSDESIRSVDMSHPRSARTVAAFQNAVARFNAERYTDEYIRHIFLYAEDDTILSSDGIYPKEQFFRLVLPETHIAMDTLDAFLVSTKSVHYDTTAAAQAHTISIVYPFHGSNQRRCLVIVLDTSKLLNTLTGYAPYSGSFFELTGTQGELLAVTPSARPSASTSLSLRVVSSQLGWSCLVSVPFASVRHESAMMMLWLAILFFLLFFAEALLSFYISLRIYFPLQSMRSLVGAKEDRRGKSALAELDALSQALEKMHTESVQQRQTLLQRYIDSAFPMLLSGSGSAEHVEKTLMEHCGFQGPRCVCAAIQHTAEVLTPAMLQPYEEAFRLYRFQAEEGLTLLLIDCPDGTDAPRLLASISRDILSRHPQEIQRIAVGRATGIINGLAKALSDCLTPLYRAITMDNGEKLLLASDAPGSARYIYSFHDELRILEAVRKGDGDAACMMIDDIILRNFESGVAHEQMLCLFRELRDTARRLAGSGAAPMEIPESSFYLCQPQKAREEIKHIFRELTHRRYPAAAIQRSETSQPPENGATLLVNRATVHISEHYMEDIGLEQIAQALGVSAKYLSRIYKEHTGVNLTEQLSAIRVTCACHLLEETNQSIGDIMALSGFVNHTTFLRVFRRATGLSPTDYRRLHSISEGVEP